MISSGKDTVLIFEPSTILREGLVQVLKKCNISNQTLMQCDGHCDWDEALVRIKPRVLVCSPSIIKSWKQEVAFLRSKYNILIVGFIYDYQHPDNTKEYDAIIHLDDSLDTIKFILAKLLELTVPETKVKYDDLLTEREVEVLKWMTSGYATKQIADTLHISTHTVNAHRKNIMRKLEIKTIAGLTIYAVLNNIITLEGV